jgi:uncharacterized membrane protein YcjF (UPF0283 family)
MTEQWIAQQFTLGNIVVLLSMVANVGWQMRRLVAIEEKLDDIEQQQAADRIAHDQTYQRRDVLEVALQGIHAELRAIAAAQAEVRQEIREHRNRSAH